ncbi:MAG: hemerythrin family protein [Planctomycetaceae bacterium]|jgi:hemerythrin|nr:hemerythrin family protein [Planctomycetaceae bacterium]
MAYTWSPALETGHPMIDSQHKELIKAINDLLAACQQGVAKDKISTVVDFLLSYTKKHFGEEEVLQQQSHYPDIANHKALHAGFVKFVTDLAAELKKEGPSPTIINKIIRGCGDWLVQHIQKEDTKVAANIKAMAGAKK